jgi:hypothetical protein
MNRHVLPLLVGALALLVVAHPLAQGGPAKARPARQGARNQPPPTVADVKLESLKTASTTPQPKVARNPFRFYEPPPPPPVRRPAASAQPTFVAAPAPTGPPPPPPITLRFIGLIEAVQRSSRVALLSDGRGGLMSGKEGDIIEGRYRVLRVGTDSLDLAYSDGRGRQTIRLSGQ